MTSHHVNWPQLVLAVNGARKERDLSWRTVGKECGVHPSTISRFSQGKPVDPDQLVSLLFWLDRELWEFTIEEVNW